MSEKEDAIALANRVLDRPFGDPDDDLRVLARQFLRALERLGEYKPPLAEHTALELVGAIGAVVSERAALQALVDRLDEIAADPEFKSVWTLHHVHGGDYRGPTWVEALERARAALKKAKGDATEAVSGRGQGEERGRGDAL